MTTNNELLFCPFCGCEGYPTYKTDDRGLQNHVVFCTNKSCGAEMVGEFSEERIIAAWNRRPPAMPADAAGLRTQLEWIVRYAEQSLKTNSKDTDDWKGDMQHIANSARRRIEGDTNAKT